MSKKLLLILCCLNLFANLHAQDKFTLNGYIKDSLTGETLISANIVVREEGRGANTNQYGFVSYVGYQSKLIPVNFDGNKTINVLLAPGVSNLNNVTVYGRKRESNVKSAQMGKIELSVNTIKALPSFLGEVDVLKSLQLLPGVRNAGEGNSGFYVRGGGPDQNLILLDDAVVYNTGHLFGFFSVFNADAIKSLSLIKGGMPPQYGGRLSSVIDIAMKDGNMNKTEVDAGIGLIASRLAIQGPLKKNKAS